MQGLDDVQVSGVNLLVLWLVEVLLSDDNTLLEEVLVDLLSVFLWNQHGEFLRLTSNSSYLEIRGSKIFEIAHRKFFRTPRYVQEKFRWVRVRFWWACTGVLGSRWEGHES